MRKIISIFFLFLIGCAPLTNVQSINMGGTGRFAQSSQNGHLYMQMDMNSPASCQAEMALSARQNSDSLTSVDLFCNTVSMSDRLPYSMTVTQIMTNSQYSIVRFLTMDACILSKKTSQKLPNIENFRFSDCTKT